MLAPQTPRPVVVVMGVAGAGKTTVGRRLAQRLAVPFFDGDDYHPAANVEKMGRGEPLDDTDRRPWLERLRRLIEQRLAEGEAAVFACSALKTSYRTTLLQGLDGVQLVFLQGSRELLAHRLAERRGHFFRPELLTSQLATLEPPGDEALHVDIQATPDVLVEQIVEALTLS